MVSIKIAYLLVAIAALFALSAASDTSAIKKKRQVSNPCLSNPCRNGASCYWLGYAYGCACASGYYGSNCQLSSSSSVVSTNTICTVYGSSLCLYGATCVASGTSAYYCVCSSASYGPNCQYPYSNLVATTTTTTTTTTSGQFYQCSNSSAVCQNGGTCYYKNVPPYTISCKCAPTFGGTFCQYPTQFCSVSPCLNGGTCVQYSGTLSGACSCPSGFTGTYCDASNCTSYNPCRNNQQCQTIYYSNGPASNSVFGLPYCFCTSQYTGIYCENIVGRK